MGELFTQESAHSFNIRLLMLSGPTELFTFKYFRMLKISPGVRIIVSIFLSVKKVKFGNGLFCVGSSFALFSKILINSFSFFRGRSNDEVNVILIDHV